MEKEIRPISAGDRDRELCEQILSLTRDELYMDFRYFDRALYALKPAIKDSLKAQATDGVFLYYPSGQLFRLFPSNPLFLKRSMLHSLLHCIFRHLWLRQNRDPFLWNLACDIAVEYVIDSFKKPSVKRILSGIRTDLYRDFSASGKTVAAPIIYEQLAKEGQDRLGTLAREFYTDDHSFWPGDQQASPSIRKAEDFWSQTGRRLKQELMMTGRDQGDVPESLIRQVEPSIKNRSYSDFLRRFSLPEEEMHADYDEMDLGYYTYGLRLYGNLPLIEPLESRESRKISEFVIVIDTSYSTSGIPVKQFLNKTFEIIRQRDSFSHKSQIRILQCDNQVRSDIQIRSEQDIASLLPAFQLAGGGGTDFRPAFSYINRLIEEGQFRNLNGILYFTDGKGIYPSAGPPCKTAFLFHGNQKPDNVPAWAISYIFSQGDFLS